jgi:ribonuclease R
VPISKGADKEWQVRAGDAHGARDGELVEAEQAGPKGRMGLPRARIVERLGDPARRRPSA